MEPEFITKILKNKDIDRIIEDDLRLYKAVDVEKVMDISNIRVLVQNFDEDEKYMRNIPTTRGNKNVLYLSTKGIYRLLHNTKKPISKEFRNWVATKLSSHI